MKSYVSVEQKQCPICGIVHDTGLLLDRRMRESLERFTLTGAALCGECQGKYDEGYIALVEVDPAQSPEGDTLKMEHEIGSIEIGKRADFAVLEADPLQVDPRTLKDVPVWGVVQGGRVFEAAAL